MVSGLEQLLQEHQAWLWFLTVMLDLGFAILLYRFFGRYGLYGAIVLSLVMANIQGPKLTTVLGLETSMAVILYSSIFFATDLLSEKFGRREAQRAVLLGFAVSVMVVVISRVGLFYAPTSDPDTAAYALRMHEAMAALFDYTPRFVFGSLLAYLLSQSFDVWVFHRIRKATGVKHLWLRNTGSTLLSQVVDTLIYGLVVWWGIVDLVTALQLAAAKYLFKFLIAVIDTPFIYWARTWKRTGLAHATAER